MSLNTILATAPLTTTNYILKATGTTIGNSLIWDNGTNVGIGNTNTTYTLDVTGTFRTTGNAILGGTTTFGSDIFTYNNGGIFFSGGGTYTSGILQNASGLALQSGTAVRMVITSAGNVGIGTTSPSKLFTVVSGSNGQSAGISGPSYGIRFDNGGTNGFGGSTIHGTDNTLTGSYQILGLSGSQLIFATDGSEKMRITSGGNVVIGDTSSANYKLLIVTPDSGTSNWGIGIFNSAGNTLLRIRNDGAFFTGTAAASPYNNTTSVVSNLTVLSDGSLARSIASSKRYKENINDWNESGLDTILSLVPKTFTYKEGYYNNTDKKFLGLIAEEVAEVSSFLADYENEDGTGQVENVRYANIVVPLIAAIKEQQALITSLQEQINAIVATK
jgi:hypothetical protein